MSVDKDFSVIIIYIIIIIEYIMYKLNNNLMY